jgi:hypothetical protein
MECDGKESQNGGDSGPGPQEKTPARTANDLGLLEIVQLGSRLGRRRSACRRYSYYGRLE